MQVRSVQPPQAWNGTIYNMIRSLSDNVIIPIAGVMLAFVMTLELIQLVSEKNNMHGDVDTWMFFKWIFKTACAILIVTNTWNIVMGVFDVGQGVVDSAAGVITSDTSIDIDSIVVDLETRLMEMDIGPLLGLWFQSLFVGILHMGAHHLHFHHHLWPYDRNISRDLRCSNTDGNDGQQGKRQYGPELPAFPVCPGIPGISHYRLCGDLCGARPEYRR